MTKAFRHVDRPDSAGALACGSASRMTHDKTWVTGRKAEARRTSVNISVGTEAAAQDAEAAVDESVDLGEEQADLLRSLVEFTREHRAARWSGTLAEFLRK